MARKLDALWKILPHGFIVKHINSKDIHDGMVIFHRYFLSLNTYQNYFKDKIQYSEEKYNRKYKKFLIVFYVKIPYNVCMT